MKAISIQQPWAWAILHAGKDVENRTWSTTYRGLVAVHATRVQDDWQLPKGVPAPADQDMVLRAVIGVVEIFDVVSRSSSKWFIGPFGFLLRNPKPLAKPVHCPGNQRIWELPPSVARAVSAQLVNDRARVQQVTVSTDKRRTIAARVLRVTQGNLDNNHLYLTEAIDLFPADVQGGPTAAQAGRSVSVHWDDQFVETDIVRRRIFRRRGWLRRFFASNRITAGDRVLLEQIEPYVYRLSKAHI